MAEYFNVRFEKVCPGCMQSCLNFSPETTIKHGLGPMGWIDYKETACEHAKICRECWNNSVMALNMAGRNTPFRTRWGKQSRYEKEDEEIERCDF